MRAPIVLYRWGLGFLFGGRLLLLEHRGRKSGARREVVLEVIGRPGPDRYVVASGFGDRAQWFRNVMADPQVRISSGARRSRWATARRLPQAEADLALNAYARSHPRAWSRFSAILDETLGEAVTLEGTRLPLVEFRLTER